MIECRALSFSYGEKLVFSQLNAQFHPGKIYGIVGPNGCGKTTLIRLLCGLNPPGEGQILLNGRPYGSYSRKELAKNLSLLPQSRSLPSVLVEELVSRGRYPYLGLTRRMTETDEDAVRKALADVHATHLVGRYVSSLSGGERQRVCLALLLAQQTPYILLDEPTTYLDISHRLSLMEQLKVLREDGKCVIAVFHDLSLAIRYCDVLGVLSEGTLQAFDSPENLLSADVFSRVFGVRCIPVEVRGQRDLIFIP